MQKIRLIKIVKKLRLFYREETISNKKYRFTKYITMGNVLSKLRFEDDESSPMANR